MAWRLGIMALSIALAGCGPGAGDRYAVPRIAELYFSKADAEDGHSRDDWYRLMMSGKVAMIEDSEVKILQAGDPWVKVEVMSGRESGSTGWIEAKNLGARR